MNQPIRFDKLANYTHGWLVGGFSPSLFKNHDVEIAIMTLKKGHKSDSHYHVISTEYNMIVSGEAVILDGGTKKKLYDGDIFVVHPHTMVNIEYTEDTRLLCIKTPSMPGDKYYPSKEESDG